MKIDDNITNYVSDLKITLNNKTFDLTGFAPGNKFWRFDSDIEKGKMYIVEGTISEININWFGYSRGLFIEVVNETPREVESSEDYSYNCVVSLDDLFFDENDCMDAANEYIKEHSNGKKITIEKKVQPGREFWETNLKKLNDRYHKISSKTTTGNKNDVNLMML